MRNLSALLEAEGVVQGAFDAYRSLVFPAFRADIWRAALIWVNGGIYMDAKIVLKKHYSTWADVHRGTLSLCMDTMVYSYWNAIFVAAPRSPALAAILRHMVRQS